MEMRYRADITAGSLKVPECRIIADLLLQGIDATGWREALYTQNVLQARSPKTVKRLVLLSPLGRVKAPAFRRQL